jgi:hypothetical protein
MASSLPIVLTINCRGYERIIYLDSDMLLVNNLDYFFDMSVSGILQSNIVMAQRFIPAGGNFLLLKPNSSRYQQIMNLINNNWHRSNGYWNFESGDNKGMKQMLMTITMNC